MGDWFLLQPASSMSGWWPAIPECDIEDDALLRRAGAAQTTLLQRDWCQAVLTAPIRREVQADGRVRFWGEVLPSDEEKPRYLRVVTLEDGVTVHNAFFDRGFREENDG